MAMGKVNRPLHVRIDNHITPAQSRVIIDDKDRFPYPVDVTMLAVLGMPKYSNDHDSLFVAEDYDTHTIEEGTLNSCWTSVLEIIGIRGLDGPNARVRRRGIGLVPKKNSRSRVPHADRGSVPCATLIPLPQKQAAWNIQNSIELGDRKPASAVVIKSAATSDVGMLMSTQAQLPSSFSRDENKNRTPTLPLNTSLPQTHPFPNAQQKQQERQSSMRSAQSAFFDKLVSGTLQKLESQEVPNLEEDYDSPERYDPHPHEGQHHQSSSPHTPQPNPHSPSASRRGGSSSSRQWGEEDDGKFGDVRDNGDYSSSREGHTPHVRPRQNQNYHGRPSSARDLDSHDNDETRRHSSRRGHDDGGDCDEYGTGARSRHGSPSRGDRDYSRDRTGPIRPYRSRSEVSRYHGEKTFDSADDDEVDIDLTTLPRSKATDTPPKASWMDINNKRTMARYREQYNDMCRVLTAKEIAFEPLDEDCLGDIAMIQDAISEMKVTLTLKNRIKYISVGTTALSYLTNVANDLTARIPLVDESIINAQNDAELSRHRSAQVAGYLTERFKTLEPEMEYIMRYHTEGDPSPFGSIAALIAEEWVSATVERSIYVVSGIKQGAGLDDVGRVVKTAAVSQSPHEAAIHQPDSTPRAKYTAQSTPSVVVQKNAAHQPQNQNQKSTANTQQHQQPSEDATQAEDAQRPENTQQQQDAVQKPPRARGGLTRR